jgi:hypothetical protein
MVLDAIVGFGIGPVPPLAVDDKPIPALVTPAAPPGPAVTKTNGQWLVAYRGRTWTIPGGTAEATVRRLAEQLKREVDSPTPTIPGNCPGGVCPVPGK